MTLRDILSAVAGNEGETSSIRKVMMTEVAILYLEIVKIIKKVFISIVAILTALFIVCGGLSFIIITMAVRSQDDLGPMAAIWLFMIIIPVVLALVIFSDRFWIKIFNADKVVDHITEPQED